MDPDPANLAPVEEEAGAGAALPLLSSLLPPAEEVLEHEPFLPDFLSSFEIWATASLWC